MNALPYLLLRAEEEHHRLDDLKRELMLIVRRVTNQTLGSTDEGVKEMHVGIHRAAAYLTHARHCPLHHRCPTLRTRSAAKTAAAGKHDPIVPICNNLDDLKSAARSTLLLDVTSLDRNIKRVDLLKTIQPVNSHL